MDRRLLEAATSGDVPSMKQLLALDGPGVLLGTTPQGNTCLHIASIQGHEDSCKNILTLDHSPAPALLSTVNKDGETPLLTAVARGCASLASVLLRCCRDHRLSEMMILKQDKQGCNALHHAIRRGHRMLALELIEAEPTLSKAVDGRNESPLFIAATRDFTEVFYKLLEIPDSPDSGAFGFNVLHAAVRSGNLGETETLVVRMSIIGLG
jgi:ankyrin repeat protein